MLAIIPKRTRKLTIIAKGEKSSMRYEPIRMSHIGEKDAMKRNTLERKLIISCINKNEHNLFLILSLCLI